MKRTLSFILALLMMLSVLSGVSIDAMAATKVGSVTKLSATINSSSSVTLKWKKTSGASKYYIYKKSGSKFKKIATSSKTSYTIKKLKSGKTYSFKVRGVSKSRRLGKMTSAITMNTGWGKIKTVNTSGVYEIHKYETYDSGFFSGYYISFSVPSGAKGVYLTSKIIDKGGNAIYKATIPSTRGKYYTEMTFGPETVTGRAYKTDSNGHKIYGPARTVFDETSAVHDYYEYLPSEFKDAMENSLNAVGFTFDRYQA